jgi:predicted SprT family Zn-dependent metalloprotease
MEVTEARALAISKMAEHKLEGWTFKFDHSKRRFGRCSYGRKLISLSRPLTLLNSKEKVLDTILHEIAHALLPPEMGHSKRWKIKAREIGCDGNRLYRTDEVVMPPAKIVYECPFCKKSVNAYKIFRTEKACGECCRRHNGGKFSRQFILKKKEDGK